MRRVVSVYLPNWATDRWQRLNGPWLAEGPTEGAAEPLALVEHRLVYAADPRALGLGVYPGMKLSQAQAMVPGLRVEPADPAGDAAALRRLAGWCVRFSPLAAPCGPDSVWIDITGCAHLHGGETGFLQTVLERLGEAGVAARVAVADTPGCAHALARHGLDAVCVVPPGQTVAAMAPLPVEALRLDVEMAAGLRQLGFDTVAQLAAAARAPLARRFGAGLLRRLDQALGRVAEPLEPVAPAGMIRVRQGFAEPIATADDLARVTTLLVARLCEKLAHAERGASRLDLVFVRVDGSPQMVRAVVMRPHRGRGSRLRRGKRVAGRTADGGARRAANGGGRAVRRRGRTARGGAEQPDRYPGQPPGRNPCVCGRGGGKRHPRAVGAAGAACAKHGRQRLAGVAAAPAPAAEPAPRGRRGGAAARPSAGAIHLAPPRPPRAPRRRPGTDLRRMVAERRRVLCRTRLFPGRRPGWATFLVIPARRWRAPRKRRHGVVSARRVWLK